MPYSQEAERPTIYADRVGEWYVGNTSEKKRKTHGIFFTSVQTADFMGKQIAVTGQNIRVLDPAAGVGILCCAAVEALVARQSRPDTIELVAYELDSELIEPLKAVLAWLARWCNEQHGVAVRVRVEARDFILTNAVTAKQRGLFPSDSEPEKFDAVIANPPYFKIGKSDPRAGMALDLVHGQPNIYSLFMAVGARLLKAGGNFIFITPRSFASGAYFQRFRTVFFDMIKPTGIHVFDSRRDAFRRDDVLQENIIFSGSRQEHWHETDSCTSLTLSSSNGVDDIENARCRKLPADMILNLASADKILRLPIREADDDILNLVDSWPTDLRGLGLKISTGPVIPFRATDLVAREGVVSLSHAPLLWMNHVRAMKAVWPLERHKLEFIKRAGAEALLIPNRNYVLLRRFSAKEQLRRLIAAPWIAASLSIADIGLENHLNYIHRPGGALSEDEAWGLAALYNSRILDTWFRTVNGNTQVSATELRNMPLPAHEKIMALGRQVKCLTDPLAGLDTLVANVVAPPPLKEMAFG